MESLRKHANANVCHVSLTRRAGLTLIEVTIAMAVLAVLLVPLCSMFLSSYEGSDYIGQFDQAFNLAQDLMEEITSQAFEDPDAGAGSFGTEEAARLDFDDVDDYDNYGPHNPPLDSAGSALVDYSAFTRRVTVVNVTDLSVLNMPRGTLTPQADGSTEFKLITVTVQWNDGQQSQILEKVTAKID